MDWSELKTTGRKPTASLGQDEGVPDLVSREAVVERVRSLRRSCLDTVYVAIDGHGGAGKSTLANKIAAEIPDVSVVCLDDFARPSIQGWDIERLVSQVLQPLLAGQPGRYRRWDWDTDSAAEWHDVPVGGVVVVEGVSSTRFELGDPWHLKIWVSTPASVRLRRGVERDGESMRATWTERWMPEEDQYVIKQRPDERADLVVDGTGADSGD